MRLTLDGTTFRVLLDACINLRIRVFLLCDTHNLLHTESDHDSSLCDTCNATLRQSFCSTKVRVNGSLYNAKGFPGCALLSQ